MTFVSSAAAAVALAFAVAGVAGSSDAGVEAAAPELYVLTAQEDSVVRSSHPLFDGSILVPLATAHDRFAVQNGSGGIAYLRIALRSVDVPDDGLRRALTLGISTARGSGPVVPLDSSGSCVTVLSAQPVAPGASVDVDAALALGDLTGTSGQAQPIGYSLLVILDADPAGAGCDTGGAGGGGGTPPPGPPERPNAAPLAATGSDLLAAIWIAAFVGGTGTAAVLATRMRPAARRRVRRDSKGKG
ncbi:hypothetical protein ASF88_00820 [Leifsonia sp. Leaf336]|uniref:hypothetical protein n=1 Tax=Leifsonia sp. Leaf336 TaxID=1736341 RepID=UPI0006F64557|nr:hypothetical protein [Leifsonia sp. Leaf336]KQR53465.1 hypothetical protein ASF88_00820 [Leifsonia sp. Leaf336]